MTQDNEIKYKLEASLRATSLQLDIELNRLSLAVVFTYRFHKHNIYSYSVDAKHDIYTKNYFPTYTNNRRITYFWAFIINSYSVLLIRAVDKIYMTQNKRCPTQASERQ